MSDTMRHHRPAPARLEPNAEYVIEDTYLGAFYKSLPVLARGTLQLRTDSEGNAWIKGIGRAESCFTSTWCAEHPRLKRVDVCTDHERPRPCLECQA